MTETGWDKEKLYNFIHEGLHGKLLIVVSNREPYVHTFSGNDISWHQPVGGLTQALDPVLRASKGTWIAQGTGDADSKVVDDDNRIAVPPDKPEYTLRRVWLTEEEEKGYYLGFANGGLWPLCHTTYVSPVFKETDWQTYQKVNRIFADAVMREIGGRPAIVLVQDYHFALLSHLLKERDPHLIVGQFWHIPWPALERLRTCPYYEEVLRGLLGNDLLGFHTPSFCRNFLESAEKGINAKIDAKKGKVATSNSVTSVEAFPISVDFAEISREAGAEAVDKEMAKLRQELNLEGKIVGIGMDRTDYTKGIPERLMALDKFFEDNPVYRGEVVFIQAGMPSRTEIPVYKELSDRVDGLIAGINRKYGTTGWQPVIPMMRQLMPVTLNALRRLAHFCVVSSLQDGMNLVAKEYVAARTDDDGVLILSRSAGAAEELTDALLIDPKDISGFADKIKAAVTMPPEERQRRMCRMRRIVAENNIYRWGASILSRLMGIAEER